MKCDELKQVENPIEWGLYYDKSEADAAIAELKAKLESVQASAYADSVDAEIASLKAENAQLKKEIEFMHSNCKWNAGDGCSRLLGEKLALVNDIVELKAKLESVQASAYADSVDAGMRERRLRRALWLARAKRANDRARIFYFNDLETMLDIDGFYYDRRKKKGSKKLTAFLWRLTWLKVERKCRAKAEEYK